MIHQKRLSLFADIGGVALPKESDGNVFALAGSDCILRIFDIRCSNSSIYCHITITFTKFLNLFYFLFN